ncbi:hypothetical protein [Ramlibacter tataouinensis]|uniref:Candidate membrane protein n=1 Tax=Ramlibacter tataouinensis (strain ATCC BAA-407 / DSM 14655 / LMG 21543 / TTB310) TaxID=365046 RepID=F5XYI3_RAMTT|nr:hypothetical protein [Ramlibacter tataouinensis]AEG93159.1 hypothetical protein Rta_20660 [Ramlibacter tataouinensis TTB310]
MYFHLTMMLVVLLVTLAMQAVATAGTVVPACRAGHLAQGLVLALRVAGA